MEPLTLTELPEVATSKDIARVFQTTEDALAQDRYMKRGLPFIRYGGRIRYLKADCLAYLAAAREKSEVKAEPAKSEGKAERVPDVADISHTRRRASALRD